MSALASRMATRTACLMGACSASACRSIALMLVASASRASASLRSRACSCWNTESFGEAPEARALRSAINVLVANRPVAEFSCW